MDLKKIITLSHTLGVKLGRIPELKRTRAILLSIKSKRNDLAHGNRRGQCALAAPPSPRPSGRTAPWPRCGRAGCGCGGLRPRSAAQSADTPGSAAGQAPGFGRYARPDGGSRRRSRRAFSC